MGRIRQQTLPEREHTLHGQAPSTGRHRTGWPRTSLGTKNRGEEAPAAAAPLCECRAQGGPGDITEEPQQEGQVPFQQRAGAK